MRMLVHIDQDTGADALPELPASRHCTLARTQPGSITSESHSPITAVSLQHFARLRDSSHPAVIRNWHRT
jgi:hypothetical protein